MSSGTNLVLPFKVLSFISLSLKMLRHFSIGVFRKAINRDEVSFTLDHVYDSLLCKTSHLGKRTTSFPEKAVNQDTCDQAIGQDVESLSL